MIKGLFTLSFICVTMMVSAQEVDVDKSTGLVKVNGVDSFYAVKKNKALFSFDISIQNKNKEELAFLKYFDVNTLPWEERANHSGLYYRITFSRSSNTVNVFPGLSTLKSVAKVFVSNKLIVNDAIEPAAEKLFVVSNKGTLFQDPTPTPINVVINNPAGTNTNTPATTADILIKGFNIFNNSELIGFFKKNVSADSTLFINVYKKDENKVCTATHSLKAADADWDIHFSDNKVITLLYNPATPLEKLFKYLAEKGYF